MSEDLLDEINTDNLEPITAVKLNLDSDSRMRKKFEALRQDLKDVTDNRLKGNKRTVEYAINKAFDALVAEENLYQEIKKTKAGHLD